MQSSVRDEMMFWTKPRMVRILGAYLWRELLKVFHNWSAEEPLIILEKGCNNVDVKTEAFSTTLIGSTGH